MHAKRTNPSFKNMHFRNGERYKLGNMKTKKERNPDRELGVGWREHRRQGRRQSRKVQEFQ